MSAKIFCATLNGLAAKIIEVEVNISSGLPNFMIVGLADASIRESKERVRSSLKNSAFEFPLGRISVNLAPANIFKYGTQFDLAIAVGLLSASGQLSFDPRNKLFLGEMSLEGQIRSVNGVLAMVLQAKANGFEEVYLSPENSKEAALVKGVKVFAVKDILQLIEHLQRKIELSPAQGSEFASYAPEVFLEDISGQTLAKRGIEIAAAGGHNILFRGPPGSGKTMLAKAMFSIMPELDYDQMLEVVKIQSAAGIVDDMHLKPFRNPNQGISLASFIGGGRIAKPGEISLAHRGILFLDEFPEFPRAIIESLRQPLEEGKIKISRVEGSYWFPADFILVAAQNPCPCGYYGDQFKKCICSAGQIHKYQRKISGPILDRIDLQIAVERVNVLDRSRSGQSSAEVSLNVLRARGIQLQRNGSKLNKKLSSSELGVFCALDLESRKILETAQKKFCFSARAIHRIFRVARTIADLEGSEKVLSEHFIEALQFRME